MSIQPEIYYSEQEYLAIEREAEYKSEYFNGEISAMSGASRKHNLVTGNISASLHTQLRKRNCEVYASEMRVKVSPTGLYTYPDIVVVCGKPLFDDAHNDTLLNPKVIIEVLSKSTENYDKGAKFKHYKTLASLSDYLLISQDKYHIEYYIRQADNLWLFSEYENLTDIIKIDSVQCRLLLEEVYEKVEI